jgi:glycerol-3-phosphate acyltransferase PlsY
VLEVLLYIFGSYLLGAIPFSLIIGFIFAGVDVRKHGSGNAGATNVYRVAGLPAALLASLFDIAKGAVPVLIVRAEAPNAEWLQIACGLAAVVGHILPVFAGFRGGKGVNTLLGVLVVLLPVETAICLMVFIVTLAVSRIVSLGSILAGVSLSLIVVIEKYAIGKNISPLLLSACLFVTLLVLFTHRANIKRIVGRSENRLSR